ncbi:MAG: DNA-directed RNA polymerase subunit alpha [Candidatus Colwellbacteria bacterium]|nr:DNA-directed RNA polymerase subunit alpha [Candidatus Colwellbacteria bacterium]
MLSIPLPNETKIIPQGKNAALFIMEGLYPGYGITLGNALRRVMLSSLSGAAIIGVNIKHVDHEFSTAPYVLEDVMTILLNLKQIRFKVHESGSYQGTLKATGERKITAKDLKIPSELEIINPEARIATLTDKRAELFLTIFIKEGLGYEFGEDHATDPLLKEVKTLKIDSVFTPITKTSFNVENMRVGQRTDYDRIKLMVETDGTIAPLAAFEKSIAILLDQFQTILSISKDARGKEGLAKASKGQKLLKAKMQKIQSQAKDETKESAISTRSSLSHLKLSSRIEKILIANSVKTIGQIVKSNESELTGIDGIGGMAVKEIRRKLGKLGFLLGGKK